MIDSDYSQLGRDTLVEKIKELWGIDNVASIMTLGTFKAKSATERWGKVTAPPPTDEVALRKHYDFIKEIKNKIPPPLFGKEPTLKEIIEGNEEKGYKPHPELLDKKYKDWYTFISYVEGMAAQLGIHAAGIVISDFPISNVLPIMKNKKVDRITQFDMKEVETLGLLKYDFLTIVNLDIIQLALNLVNKNHNLNLTMQDIQDGDEKTYKLLGGCYLSGIFQMETSDSARDLISRIQPTSIEELSDISALEIWGG